MTIVEAIAAVLAASNQPMSIADIHKKIEEQQLFQFRTKGRAVDIVHQQVRRHCANLNIPSATAKNKPFLRMGKDKYTLAVKPQLAGTQGLPTTEPKQKENGPTTAVVTAPDDAANDKAFHGRAQMLLRNVGLGIGVAVWIAKNDRNRVVDGSVLSEGAIPSLAQAKLHDDAAHVMEYVDTVWLEGPSVRAAFEVIHTTSVYSGLCRLADLVVELPNNAFDIYIVAAKSKRNKVLQEVNRPFARTLKLHKKCRFLAYEDLRDLVNNVSQYLGELKPTVLKRLSESCEQGKWTGYDEESMD